MKNQGVPIVKEGLPFLLVALVTAFGFYVGGYLSLGIFFLLLTFFIAYFFRNPERLPPVGSAMVGSPADGKILSVGVFEEKDFSHQKMQRVSIFLSIWDVHVNRVPVDGTVKNMKYHRGRFMAAFEERSSDENERNAILIETDRGEKVVVVQIAGLIARRIICYPTIGIFVLKGQRMGLIRFGSRTDIYLPETAEILVKPGDRVVGGETIIAQLKDSK